MRASRAWLLVVSLAAGACENSTGPLAATIRIVDGGGGSDTVLAMANAPLIVEIRDELGRPMRGAQVQFMALPATPAEEAGARRGMYVCPVRQAVCAWYYDDHNYTVTTGTRDVTDDAGRVSANVQFGVVAGQTGIEVSVLQLGVARTIQFTTLPGSLARVVAAVPDTAVYVGASYTLDARAADRFGNARTEPVALSSATPAVAAVVSGRVNAVDIGRGRVLMQAGPVSDTAYVSVPPPGRLVALGWAPDGAARTQLTLVNTDGSGRRVILSTPGDNGNAYPAWSRDAGRIVFQEASAETAQGQLHVTDTLGNRRLLLTDAPEFRLTVQPAFSADGAALYFLGERHSTGVAGIYRVNPDGTGSDFLFGGVQPAPSPDGSRVAYVSGTSLFVRDLATGDTSLIASNPVLPRWSPSEEWIAFVSYDGQAEVRIVRPDGSGLHTVGSGFHHHGVSWSPDGEWLVAKRYGGVLELIRVADGERLPIPTTEGLSQPDWRP